jgi:hypothetical protein
MAITPEMVSALRTYLVIDQSAVVIVGQLPPRMVIQPSAERVDLDFRGPMSRFRGRKNLRGAKA